MRVTVCRSKPAPASWSRLATSHWLAAIAASTSERWYGHDRHSGSCRDRGRDLAVNCGQDPTVHNIACGAVGGSTTLSDWRHGAQLPCTRPELGDLAGLGTSKLLLSHRIDDIISAVKQLLLRVPDDVHRRLTARAAREGRSVNAVATEILDAAADADVGDRRARLRARAAGLGVVRELPAETVNSARRRRIIASTKGFGPLADRLLADERDRT